MVFADDERESNPTSFKFLQNAHAWAQKAKKGGASLSAVLPALAPSRTTQETKHDEPPNKTQSSGEHKENGDDSASDVASSQGDEDED